MKINYITIFSTQKNFGGEINRVISEMADDSWICLLDGDTMFLTHDWGNIVEQTVKEYGDKFQLFGCVTNRCNRPHQLHGGRLNDNMDIRNHVSIAEQRKADYDGIVSDVTSNRQIAGLFMLFHKSTWDRCKFIENNRRFDDIFCRDVISKGGKIGLIKSLYIFHAYRPMSSSPTNDWWHLENNLHFQK